MFKAHSLGRLLGVEIKVHGTLLLLVAILTIGGLLSGGLGSALATLILVAFVGISVTLHELGHIFAARLFGIGTAGVTLYPFGGLARLTREARTATEEIVVALAGPAVNVFLAGLAAIPIALFGPNPILWTFLGVNVALAVFNLIPAYPMDGGRVLRGALWHKLGHRKATLWAARAGQGFSVLFGIAGLFYSPMLVVIAAFIFLQASGEIARLKLMGYQGSVVNPDGPGGPVVILPPEREPPVTHPWATFPGRPRWPDVKQVKRVDPTRVRRVVIRRPGQSEARGWV